MDGIFDMSVPIVLSCARRSVHALSFSRLIVVEATYVFLPNPRSPCSTSVTRKHCSSLS